MTLFPKVAIGLLAMMLSVPTSQPPYPVDGYATTGIRRLVRLERIISGEINGTPPVAGALMPLEDIALNLAVRDRVMSDLPEADAAFTGAINAIFPGLDQSYSIAVLDITPDRPVRFAQRKGSVGYQPGSVGKIAVMAGFFAEIRKIFPDSFARRQELMRTKNVRAGIWAMTDSHTVPFFDPETNVLVRRTVREGDIFSLYEWMDHMMSVSNNGAASVVWREAVLMRVFGSDYPALTEEQATAYFRSTPKSELSDIAISVVNDPLRALGITEEEWKLGTFFTRGASTIIPPKGGSIGSANGVMKFLLHMESGKAIDYPSSLEMKRMMYMTDRRIRYAASPALTRAAVYFKSGSLYSCQAEEGYTCIQYQGNRNNFMNSVAIVEHEDGTTYLSVLMSNVLKKNSASDHLELASSIDRIVRAN